MELSITHVIVLEIRAHKKNSLWFSNTQVDNTTVTPYPQLHSTGLTLLSIISIALCAVLRPYPTPDSQKCYEIYLDYTSCHKKLRRGHLGLVSRMNPLRSKRDFIASLSTLDRLFRFGKSVLWIEKTLVLRKVFVDYFSRWRILGSSPQSEALLLILSRVILT